MSTFLPTPTTCRLPSSVLTAQAVARSARAAPSVKRPAWPCPGPAAASQPGSTASAATRWAPQLTAALPYGRPPPPTTVANATALLHTAALWPSAHNRVSTTPAQWSKSCCLPCLRTPAWRRKAGWTRSTLNCPVRQSQWRPVQNWSTGWTYTTRETKKDWAYSRPSL